MYLLLKILSFAFVGIFSFLVFRFIFLLFKGESKITEDVMKLLFIFLFASFFFISYVITAYKSRNLYIEESLKNGDFSFQEVIFTGMVDGSFTKNSQPKDTYFTYRLNKKSFKIVLNSDLDQKAKQLKVGDKVQLKYIKGELFYNSNIILDIHK